MSNVTVPLDDDSRIPLDTVRARTVEEGGESVTPEPVGLQAVILAVYGLASYLLSKHAPGVWDPEVDKLTYFVLLAVLGWRTRSVVTPLRGLFSRSPRQG